MQHLYAIGEDEMVAVFLQTEVASMRFAPIILAILRRDGRQRRIIDQPDLSNAADNAYRRHVLGEYRGYGRDADVFKMADALAKGASFPELILVGADEHAPLVLLEGHVRLTAYFLQPDCIPPSLPVIVGYAEGMVKSDTSG